MNRPTRYLLQSILLGLLSLPLTACALSGEAVEGTVREEGTNKPIPGTIVVVRWHGTAFSFVESPTVCVHVETTTADAQGRYRIPAWRKEFPIKGVRDVQPTVTAHQPGYQESERYEKDVQYLKPFTGGRGERLGYLMHVLDSTRCGTNDESERNLHPLYKALYEEGNGIAVTEREKEMVDTLRYWSTFVLFDPSKPSTRDAKGRLINIDPREQKR